MTCYVTHILDHLLKYLGKEILEAKIRTQTGVSDLKKDAPFWVLILKAFSSPSNNPVSTPFTEFRKIVAVQLRNRRCLADKI